ncbi:MAG: PKD domain-containing protein, partial [Cyclobacteriaceae bacterium]
MRYFLYIVLTIFCCSVLSQDLSWPTAASQPPRETINGTPGEYRNNWSNDNNPRFHRGVDLAMATGENVYAVASGTATWNPNGVDSFIRIVEDSGRELLYVHINATQNILDEFNNQNMGVAVETGDLIGTINAGNHLHFQLNVDIGDANNILNSMLNPYTDLDRPFLSTEELDDGIAFYLNGLDVWSTNYQNSLLDQILTIDGTEYKIVYNKIDIATHVIDHRVSATGASTGAGQLSVFGYEWGLVDSYDQQLFTNTLDFNNLPNNDQAEWSFHPLSDQPGDPTIHFITSDPYNLDATIRDRFFNTRLTDGQTESFLLTNERDGNLDASLNQFAEYPDGLYTMHFDAYDVDYDANPNNRLERPEEIELLIDNFKPFIERVIIRVEPNGLGPAFSVYDGRWTYIPSDNWLDFNLDNPVTLPTIQPEDNLFIDITSSEELSEQTEFLPSIRIDGEIVGHLIDDGDNNARTATFSLPASTFDLSGADNGVKELQIHAYDLAGNLVTGFYFDDYQITMEELPYHIGEDQWSAGSRISRPDTRHSINVGGDPCEFDGGRLSTNSCPLLADFTVGNIDELTVSFLDNSTPIDVIDRWEWDFGDNASSTLQNPIHSYNAEGTYTVMLTVYDDDVSVSDTYSSIVTVSESQALVASFEISSESGSSFGGGLDDEVSLHSTSTGSITSYFWTITPGSQHTYTVGSSSTPDASLVFQSSGFYEIKLTVSDGTNSVTSDPKTYQVSSNVNTWVSFTVDGVFLVTESKQVFSDVGNPCGTPNYTWKDGNGQLLAGNVPNPLIQFNTTGTKTIVLSVTDDCGEVAEPYEMQ